MNISEIHVADFGAWHELTLDQLGPGATVFYGPNEAGKTTLLNFIRTVLYGFAEPRCDRYLPPAFGTQAGGWLSVSGASDGKFRVHRTASADYLGGPGTLRVQTEDHQDYGNELLTTILAGVDETIFNNVFAVGLTQMQQLATLSDTEAAKQLYGLATGVDRVSLFDVTQELERLRHALLPTDGDSRGHIDTLFETKERLERERKALRRDAGHFAQLRTDYRQLCAQIEKQESASKSLDGESSWQETSAAIRGYWTRCLELNRRLTKLGPVADIPPPAAQRLEASRQQLASRRCEWEGIRDERRQLKANASKLRGCDALYQHAAEIAALDRQRNRCIELEAEVLRGQADVEELEFGIQAELEELGIHAGIQAKDLPPLSDGVIEALREPARETRALRQVVESYKVLANDHRREAEAVQNKLESASLRFDGEAIEQALQRSFHLVQTLERRINLDEEREEIIRRLDELDEDTHYWRQRTVLPWSGVLTTCCIFSIGAMLLMTGLLNSWFDLADAVRIPMMAIGGAVAVISLVMKGGFEYSAREKADLCEQQIALLHEEQDRAKQESSELDQALPAGSGNLDQRLVDARQELAELDEFVPLRNRYHELIRQADSEDHQATLALRQLKDARRAWKASLRAVGLPDSLTPAQIGKMSGRVGDIARLRNLLQEARQAIADREQALSTIRARMQELLGIGEVHEVLDGVAAQLDRLVRELETQSKAGRQRAELRKRWDELKTKQDQIAQMAQQILQKRRQLLALHGLSSMREFQQSLIKARRAKRMRQQRDALLQQIHELTGDTFPVVKLKKLLNRCDPELLDHLEQMDTNREALGKDLAARYEQRGEMKQKLDSYMTDRRGERKQLEVNAVAERIRVAFSSWHRATIASCVLDRIKANYETKRQPVALAEASRHLERLTEGRYRRIWTPMGQNSLCVDDPRQQSISVGKLSRGTRELVYLALRLALVGSYNRRGAKMPMVLDDVFVNFDDKRARAAAHVVADVAKAGQQFLIFTCHQRIQTIFSNLACDVRDLPKRELVVSDDDDKMVSAPSGQETAEQEDSSKTIRRPETPTDMSSHTRAETIPLRDDEPLILSKGREEPSPNDESLDRFQPAWRDEFLVPLPDLVAD